MSTPAGSNVTLVKALEALGPHDHLCLLYDNRDSQFAAAIPFLRIGLERGEQCLYIADDNTAEAVLGGMRAEGIDVDSTQESGALAVVTKQDAYLKEGHFDPDWMIRFLVEATDAAKAAGYSALRITGEMTWALGEDTGVDRLMEYEAKLNNVFPEIDALAICQYNRERFPPEMILDVIHTHPTLVADSMVCRNMFYVPPEEFLVTGDISGAVDRMLDTIQDRARAEAALLREKDRAQTYLDIVGVVLVALDAHGGVSLINEKGCEVLGCSEENILGKTWFDSFVPEESRAEDRARFDMLMAGKVEPIEYFEGPILTKVGEERIIYWHNTLLRDETGNVTGTLSSGEDVTERRQLEQQFLQAQKMEAVGRLAGGIAHDFNNALTVIRGNVDLGLSDMASSKGVPKRLEAIGKAASHAETLTRQLLAFSRRQIIAPVVLDINEVIDGLSSMLQRLIGEDIELVAVHEQGLARIKADPGQIEQVLMNLSVNAREAMPGGGKITIETKAVELDDAYASKHPYTERGWFVMLAVSDTGHGMSKDIQAKIFEPFFSTKGEGTGLGLSTVYGIAKQNSGSVEVYSEEGIGTTFKVYLPLVDAEAEPFRVKPSIRELPSGGETILLVEDDDGVRELTAEVLEDLGYALHVCVNAEKALRLCEETGVVFDLLLTDVVMPQTSGPELAARLQPSQPLMQVLYMSGYTDNAIVRHGVLEDGVTLLSKPFTPATLAEKVREVLDRQR
jgi:PAS domain S-box-containing protein